MAKSSLPWPGADSTEGGKGQLCERPQFDSGSLAMRECDAPAACESGFIQRSFGYVNFMNRQTPVHVCPARTSVRDPSAESRESTLAKVWSASLNQLRD